MANCNNTMNKTCDVNGCSVTYIGAKYLTTFANPILWNVNTNYEPFTIVQDERENSYISKGYVPAGIELTNTKYWALIYQFNVQIKNISDRVTIVEGDITALESKTDQTNTDLTALTARVSTAESDITALDQFRPTSETFALPSSLTGTGYKIHTPTNPASNGTPQNKIVDIMINATAQATSTGYLIIGFTALANPNYVVSVTPVDSTSGGEVYGKYRYGIKNKTNSGFDLYALDESGNKVTTGLLSFSIHIKGVEQ